MWCGSSKAQLSTAPHRSTPATCLRNCWLHRLPLITASYPAAICQPERVFASRALPSLHAPGRQMSQLLHAAGHLGRLCCPCWAVCRARRQCWWICCSMPYCGCVTMSCATSDAISNMSRLQPGKGADIERRTVEKKRAERLLIDTQGQSPAVHLQLQMEHVAQLSTFQLQLRVLQTASSGYEPCTHCCLPEACRDSPQRLVQGLQHRTTGAHRSAFVTSRCSCLACTSSLHRQKKQHPTHPCLYEA